MTTPHTQDDARDTGPDVRPSGLSPLKYPVFRNVWAASTLSNVGGLIQSVGAAWLMVAIARSADMVALVQASLTLPVVLLSLVAGAMADSYDRRRVMIGAQVFLFIVSISLAVCSWAGWITPWLLLAFTFAIGCGAAFNAPAWQASVGDMVPRAEIPGAVSLNSVGFNIARSLGPAVGGAIVAAAGAATAFAVNAVSYLPLLVVLARWRPALQPPSLPRETLGQAIGAGIRYVAMSPALRTVLLRAATFGIAAGSVMALMPVVASVLLRGGPLTYGLLLGSFGAGAVVGALGNAQFRRRFTTEVIVRGASVVFALATALIGISGNLALTMLGLFFTGAGWLLALSTFNVTVQMSAPRWVVARALSLYQMAAFSGIAAGSWLWGEVAAAWSVSDALLCAGGVMLVGIPLGLWLPLAPTDQLNLDLLRRWKEPTTVVPVEPRTGPVVITIEYRIREVDLEEFLATMVERRRIRRRDGARNWRLLRDLADPLVWVERYETPTWLDYVRHNTRFTHQDAVIHEKLRALHQGPEPPRVRRMIERQSAPPPTQRTADTHIDPRMP